jgi:hypothetical protein
MLSWDEKRKKTMATLRAKRKAKERTAKERKRGKALIPIKTMTVIPFYLTGWSIGEIAEQCNMTEGEVRGHISRYNEEALKHNIDMNKFQEELRRDAMPLARKSLLNNLDSGKERTTLEFMDRMGGFPDKNEDKDALLKGQAPEALVFTLVEKIMEHPVMGPRFLSHVQLLAERNKQKPEPVEVEVIESFEPIEPTG